MNIISGIAKGIKLEVPKGLSVRPTAARARKSIFDSIGNWNGLIVVDLFAGSGALGLEAASRGAGKVYFSEINPHHCIFIKNNISRIQKAGVASELNLLRCDSLLVHRTISELSCKVNIIFADPPYKDASRLVAGLFNNLEFAEWARNSLFILECPAESSRKPLMVNFKYWKVVQIKSKGQSDFYYLKTT